MRFKPKIVGDSVRKPFIFTYVTLILVGLLLPSWLTIPASSQGTEPKTYTIWSVSVSGDWISSLQTIPDINGDGHEDVFVVSKVTGNGYLILVDGKTGSVIQTTSPLGYEPAETVYISGYIAVAKTGGIDVYEVYDTQIIYRYPISASASDVTPEKLQTFDGTDLVFIDGTNVKCILLSTGGEKWTRPGTITVEDLLVLSPQRAVYVWRNWLANTWYLLLIDNDGNTVSGPYSIKESTYSDYVYLNSYDQTHFLYTKTNDTTTVLRCDSIIGDTVTMFWGTQIDKWSGVFTIIDTNNDGMKEVIAPWGGYLSVYSGADGALLYMTGIDAYDIGDVAVVSDVDGDGVNDVAVYAGYDAYLISFRYSTYGIWWEEWYGYYGIEAIQDVDGDGRKDVIVAGSDTLYCYWGYYDDKPPSIELVSPANNTYITSKDVTFQVNSSDSQSGIDYVRISVDWWYYDGAYNPTTGYYEVTLTLSEGEYSWYAYAYDKVGYGGYSEKTATAYLTVDATPPTVTITSPTSDADFETTSITVTWSGFDEISGIDYYMVRMDDGSWINVDTSTSYTFTDLSEGPHVATVKAVDKAGLREEVSVSFTIGMNLAADLTSQAESKIDSAKAAGFWSGEAKSLLDKAVSEHEVATQLFEAGDYESAKVHAQNAISYIEQAYAVESSFKTILGIIGTMGVTAIVGITTYFLKIRKRKKAQKTT